MGKTLIEAAGGSFMTRGKAAESPAARLLALAAAPTFAVMALWTGVASGPPEAMCLGGGGTFSLSGMAAMYALMGVFHASPWLALLSARRPSDRT